MAPHNTDPGSTPDATSEESTEDDSPTAQSTRWDDGLALSRRATLASVLGLGGLGLTSGTAAAGSTKTWKKDRDANGQNLFNLGTLAMQANETEISSFEGDGLNIDGNGVLNATVTDTRTNVSDDGTEVVADVEDIDFGANLAVADDDDGSVTVDADRWDTRVDADGNDIVQIGGLQTLDNKTKITDFEGANLTIDGNTLDADTWDTDVDAGGNSLTGADTVETANLSIENVGAFVRTGSQTVTDGTKVEFSEKEFDTQGEFDLSNNEFVAADDGFYRVSVSISVLFVNSGERVQLTRVVQKDGTKTLDTLDTDRVESDDSQTTYVSFSSLHQLSSNDKVFARLGKTGSDSKDYVGEMQVHQVG